MDNTKLIATLKMIYCPKCGRWQSASLISGKVDVSFCCIDSAKVGNPIIDRFNSGDYSDMIP